MKMIIWTLSLISILMINACGSGGSTDNTVAEADTGTDAVVDSVTDTNDTTANTVDTEPKAAETFAYETQRDVDISISFLNTDADTPQKQILIYETKTVEKLYDEVQIDDEGNTQKIEIGEQNVFSAQLLDSSTNENHQLIQTFTLGRHINSLWVVIPSEQYETEITIENNKISLELNVNN